MFEVDISGAFHHIHDSVSASSLRACTKLSPTCSSLHETFPSLSMEMTSITEQVLSTTTGLSILFV